MKALLTVFGSAGLIAGLLFALQGAGIVRWPADSFMVDSTRWILYGLILAGIGLVLLGFAIRTPRR